MIPPQENQPGADPEMIYSRMLTAVTGAGVRRAALGPLAAEIRPSLYLGREEWQDLTALLKKWGVEWSGAGETYDPAAIEDSRAEFKGVKIYRVDASQHLTAV